MKLTPLENVHIVFFFFLDVTVNKHNTDKTENIFYLIAETSGYMKYTLNKLDKIIWIKWYIFFQNQTDVI